MRTVVSVLLALSLSTMTKVVCADFLNNGDGTVTDLSSNLMWQQCSAPSTGTNCGSGTPATYIWDDALAYCNGLGLAGNTDWRLPNVKALQSILDVTKTSNPTINTTYFPDTLADRYWSSTTLLGTGSMAWYVPFDLNPFGFAMTSPVTKSNGLYIRCVRGG